MEFKYIVFLIVFILGVPAGVMLCFFHEKVKYFFVVLMMWTTCVPESTGINFVSREFYKSMTRGFEVNLTDICVLVLFFYMLMKSDEYKMRWFPPLTLPYAFYILICFLSWTFSGAALEVPSAASRFVPYNQFEIGLYPLFELFKILRGCLLYFVIVNFIRSEKDMKAIMYGLVAMGFYIAFIAIKSRYIGGIHRVKATLGHPNSLSTYMAICSTVVFALCLQSKTFMSSMFYAITTGLGGITIILTISRGGLMSLAVGLWMGFVTFFRRHFNVKNSVIIFLGVLMGGIVLSMAADTLMGRFSGEQDAGEDMAYRQLYNDEAKLMAKENIFGIGGGNFSAWSWCKYARAVDPHLSPGTPPHNAWYLTLGELGWFGLLAFIIIWLRVLSLGLRYLFRKDKGLISTMAGASMLALMVGHIQFSLQLSYRQTSIYFLVRILMAVVAAVWCIEKEEKRKVTSTLSR